MTEPRVLDREDCQEGKYAIKWRVLSSNGQTCYTVSLTRDDNYVCSCPHHIYRGAQCKHINLVKNQETQYGTRREGFYYDQ